MRGLVASLRRGGVPAGRDLEPEGKWAESFPFIIRDENTASPRLDHPPKGGSAGIYQVRRAGRGLVRLTAPMGLRPYEVEVNGPGQALENGFELAFRDTRNPGWTGPRASRGPITPEPVATPSPPATADDWNGSGNWSGSGDWAGSGNWNGGGAPATPTAPNPTSPPRGNDQEAQPTIPITPATPPPEDKWL